MSLDAPDPFKTVGVQRDTQLSAYLFEAALKPDDPEKSLVPRIMEGPSKVTAEQGSVTERSFKDCVTGHTFPRHHARYACIVHPFLCEVLNPTLSLSCSD